MHWAAFGARVRRLAVTQRVDAVLSFIDRANVSVLLAMEGSGVPVIVEEVSQPFARAELDPASQRLRPLLRSEEHTSELQSLMRISYAVLCLKKKNHVKNKI